MTDPIRNDQGADRRRRILAILFMIYLAVLVWLVLWKLHLPYIGDVGERAVKLVPFVAGNGYGSSARVEVLQNLAIFFPFGIYLGLLAPSWRWRRHLAVMAAASLGLEVLQFVLASGSSDLTDVIVNTAGGVLGLGMIAIARRWIARRFMRVATVFCAASTVVMLLTVGVVIGSFPLLRPGPGAPIILVSSVGPIPGRQPGQVLAVPPGPRNPGVASKTWQPPPSP
ncbi:VanZ family protein [Herbiconiux sp. L3-i23]|uniref:VanZ family protein n=1 Tax=Herbiconiux sp. L3-i23 TaxID=2905871 RepID=UPI00205E4806|nr:VanZ family protein [Herbiconiux sp. L3-i23]BDI22312.1 hypothetical protein L3i23_10880 [Herbiconiux sp. L3-i23]